MKTTSLTEGKITSVLIKLSLPIILTNFIQTAYGMVDMIWIGKLGSNAVAAIGTATFFINLALALFALILIGTGVKIAQSIGAGNEKEAGEYIKNSFLMSIILAGVYCIIVVLFKEKLIGFYGLSPEVEKMSINYLMVSIIGIIFMYFNALMSTILNSFGDSKTPFKANCIGFVFNILLDPILIFGFGSFGGLGVVGAAIATLSARIIVTLIFLLMYKEFIIVNLKQKGINLEKIKLVVKMGAPVSMQRVTFTLISILIGKIIADFGETAIAVQKVGVQIESISFMTIGGLQGAIAAFIGQNYGANKINRVKSGYKIAIILTCIFGAVITTIFMIFPQNIFKVFIQEPQAVSMGVDYIRILAISQVFMCMEIITVGAFNGIGKTYAPPIVSVIFTALRIPIALVLSLDYIMGINGVWMSISVSSLIKGILLVGWFIFILKKMSNVKEKKET
ncbi:MAG: MATE family efflux transporter [Clostridium sp.]